MVAHQTVYVICGVHNNLEHTKKLLSCLVKQDFPNIKIVIIDDGSFDGTEKYLRVHHPDITVLKGNGNLWWTGSIYAGVEEALKTAVDGDYIFIINNDCVFAENLMSLLVKASRSNGNALVGSLALDIDERDTVWDGGIKIDWKRGDIYGKPLKNIAEIPPNVTIDKDIDALTTKGTIYPIRVFKKIGNFDKINLPHYLSDYEFACRAKRAGFILILNYKAKVYNDIVRTGLGDTMPKFLTYGKFWQLLFSRRSRLNIVDQYKFIQLCCPRKYLPQNYFFLIMKFFYLLSFTFPFIIFRPITVFLRKTIINYRK